MPQNTSNGVIEKKKKKNSKRHRMQQRAFDIHAIPFASMADVFVELLIAEEAFQTDGTQMWEFFHRFAYGIVENSSINYSVLSENFCWLLHRFEILSNVEIFLISFFWVSGDTVSGRDRSTGHWCLFSQTSILLWNVFPMGWGIENPVSPNWLWEWQWCVSTLEVHCMDVLEW